MKTHMVRGHVPWLPQFQHLSTARTPSKRYDPQMIYILSRQETWDPFDPEVLGEFVPLLLGLEVHRQPITVVVLEVLLTMARPRF